MKYFIHPSSTYVNLKARSFFRKYRAKGYAFYFRLLEMLAQEKSNTIQLYSKFDDLYADDLWLDSVSELYELVEAAVEKGLLNAELWAFGTVSCDDLEVLSRSEANKAIRNGQVYAYRKLASQVFERDGYQCVYCGLSEKLSIDHIYPLSRGGSNELSNLATACTSCNSSKGNRTPQEWQEWKDEVV